MSDKSVPPPADPTPIIKINAEDYVLLTTNRLDDAPYFYARSHWDSRKPNVVKLEWSHVPARTIAEKGVGLHHHSVAIELPLGENTDKDYGQRAQAIVTAMAEKTVACHQCVVRLVDGIVDKVRLGTNP